LAVILSWLAGPPPAGSGRTNRHETLLSSRSAVTRKQLVVTVVTQKHFSL
jgi:hypothetical protein